MSRDNSKTWNRDIEWGGDIYPVGVKVDAEFSFTVIEVAYEYAFLKRDKYELDGSIGLHYTDMSASLKAKAEVSGGQLEGDISNSASVAAPLPVIGLRGIWDLSHNFWLDATAQYFALSIDDIDGSLQDYRVLVTWQPKKWLGIGIGYNRFKLDVDVNKDDFNGVAGLDLQRPDDFLQCVVLGSVRTRVATSRRECRDADVSSWRPPRLVGVLRVALAIPPGG